jgi:DNA-binding transcriptional MocR family regulator
MNSSVRAEAVSEPWTPSALANDKKPRYLALVEALEADIGAGRVPLGARLPPQREMAVKLGLSVATVAKACAEATRRGLISGEVGRGTFVIARPPSLADRRRPAMAAPVNMTLNVSPAMGEDLLVGGALAMVASGDELGQLLTYLPHPGLPAHRAAVAGWLALHGTGAPADRVVLCNGAQHGIAIALSVAARPGATILTEAATYAGISALAEINSYQLRGVAMDEQGLRPDALHAAFTATQARVLYCMPMLQTPTGAIMTRRRREEITAVVREHDALVVEDDVYSFLVPRDIPALALLMPKRVFYVSSFAKCAGPGLRMGALVLPDWALDRAKTALRASS